VLQGPTWANISDVHVGADDVGRVLADVRTITGTERHVTWWLDPWCEPADLRERLRALGLADPADRVPVVYRVRLDREPAPLPPGVEIRSVAAFEDFETAMQIAWEAFETPQERRRRERSHLRANFDEQQKAGVPRTFIASVDGEPAGVGRSVYGDGGVFLIAGAVLPSFRGRGVYRALVRARWDDAVELGTPLLVTEANPETSYPILKRLGFVDVCPVRRLEDPVQTGGSAPAS